MFFVVKRATLLIPSGAQVDPHRKHLFVCLTNPHGVNQEILLVSVSSYRVGVSTDMTCRLFAGDHSFITHDSVIDYASARVEPSDKLVKGVNLGLFVAKEPLDSAIFARVCYGLTQSRFVAPKFLQFYERATGN